MEDLHTRSVAAWLREQTVIPQDAVNRRMTLPDHVLAELVHRIAMEHFRRDRRMIEPDPIDLIVEAHGKRTTGAPYPAEVVNILTRCRMEWARLQHEQG